MERGDITIENNAVQITFTEGTVWLSQHQIANLFDCFYSKISANSRSILKNGILREAEVMKTHRFDGGSVDLYNLEMITALAFHIDTPNAKVFRGWAMKRLAAKSVTPQLPIVIYYNSSTFLC